MENSLEGYKSKSQETSEAVTAVGLRTYRMPDLKAFPVSVRLEKNE